MQVVSASVRPIEGTLCPNLRRGPVWDLVFASSTGAEVAVHPEASNRLQRWSTRSDEERAAAERRHKKHQARLDALYERGESVNVPPHWDAAAVLLGGGVASQAASSAGLPAGVSQADPWAHDPWAQPVGHALVPAGPAGLPAGLHNPWVGAPPVPPVAQGPPPVKQPPPHLDLSRALPAAASAPVKAPPVRKAPSATPPPPAARLVPPPPPAPQWPSAGSAAFTADSVSPPQVPELPAIQLVAAVAAQAMEPPKSREMTMPVPPQVLQDKPSPAAPLPAPPSLPPPPPVPALRDSRAAAASAQPPPAGGDVCEAGFTASLKSSRAADRSEASYDLVSHGSAGSLAFANFTEILKSTIGEAVFI